MVWAKFGVGAAVVAALWGLHVFDRAQAVKSAVSGLVTEAALAEAQAIAEGLQARLEAEQEANRKLQIGVRAAHDAMGRFEKELEVYARETHVPQGCRVGDALFGRLRGQ
jgi:hypothetical protein